MEIVCLDVAFVCAHTLLVEVVSNASSSDPAFSLSACDDAVAVAGFTFRRLETLAQAATATAASLPRRQ